MIKALVSVCVLGAALSLFLGFVLMVVGGGAQFAPGRATLLWIQHPEFYWPWPVFGALIAALVFWVARVIKRLS